MKQVIYIDVLVFLNIFVTFFLVLAVNIILHKKTSVKRMALSSVFGGACSLVIFIPSINIFISIAIKILFSVIITFIAFKWQGLKDCLKTLGVFFCANFVFAGLMLGVWFSFKPQGMIYNNGTVYFNINAGWLIFSTILSYIIICMISWILKRKIPNNYIYQVSISMNGKTVKGNALLDTGNSLKDCFSDTPVVVCDLDFITPLLEKDSIPFFTKAGCDIPENNMKIRFIPFNDIRGGGVLPSFAPEEFIIIRGNKETRVEKVYIAARKGKLAQGEYVAILNSEMVKTDESGEKSWKKLLRS